IKDPSLIVPAKKVWAESKETLNFLNRKYNRPQEKLLMGLGKASQIYNPIEKSLHQSKPEGILLTTGQAHQFLKEAAVLLKQSGFSVLIPSWWKSNKKKSTIGLKLTLKSKKSSTTSKGILTYEGIIKYNWQLALGDETLSKEEFKKIVELKEPLTHVRGKWVLLNQDNLKKALSFLNNKTRGELSITDALKLSVQKENTHFGLPLHGFSATGWISDFFDKLSHTSKIKMLEQPNTFQGELRPYQIKGFSWLYFMKRYGLGTCLADDMGLGKTIQILALLLKEKENGMNKPSLLVCPTSILGNWKREAHQFSPSLNVMIHHGSNRKTRKEFRTIVKRKDLIITSYGLTYRDKTDLMSIEWHGLILDEAQKIKNYYTRRSQAVRKLNANFRIALTGTPIENRLSELWSIMEFLNPGYFDSLPQFRKNYIIPIERYNNKKVRARLKKVIQPFILRRLKTDPTIIKDLPEKIEKKEYCRLTQEQATLYKAIVKNLLKKVDNEEGIKRKGVILSTIMRLKQLCDHPVLYLTDSSKISKRSTKLIRLVELMEELLDEGHSALIFTQFKKMGNIIQRVLQQTFNQEVLFLHGGTSQQKRDKMVTRFSRENGPRIFILSLRAGGLGLNLTRANHVFHFDRWWNPAVENQATDRAYRIGQTKNVLVYKFICEGTIEEKIEDLINSKKHLAKSIIGSGEGWITELTTEQLRDIFKLKQEIF
ncbi:MAG: DEAD/DEAH box helicase, partial [Promethearchaeia archaeon]